MHGWKFWQSLNCQFGPKLGKDIIMGGCTHNNYTEGFLFKPDCQTVIYVPVLVNFSSNVGSEHQLC